MPRPLYFPLRSAPFSTLGAVYGLAQDGEAARFFALRPAEGQLELFGPEQLGQHVGADLSAALQWCDTMATCPVASGLLALSPLGVFDAAADEVLPSFVMLYLGTRVVGAQLACTPQLVAHLPLAPEEKGGREWRRPGESARETFLRMQSRILVSRPGADEVFVLGRADDQALCGDLVRFAVPKMRSRPRQDGSTECFLPAEASSLRLELLPGRLEPLRHAPAGTQHYSAAAGSSGPGPSATRIAVFAHDENYLIIGISVFQTNDAIPASAFWELDRARVQACTGFFAGETLVLPAISEGGQIVGCYTLGPETGFHDISFHSAVWDDPRGAAMSFSDVCVAQRGPGALPSLLIVPDGLDTDARGREALGLQSLAFDDASRALAGAIFPLGGRPGQGDGWTPEGALRALQNAAAEHAGAGALQLPAIPKLDSQQLLRDLDVPISPATQRRLDQIGVDVASLEHKVEQGRQSIGDLMQAAARMQPDVGRAAAAAAAFSAALDEARKAQDEVQRALTQGCLEVADAIDEVAGVTPKGRAGRDDGIKALQEAIQRYAEKSATDVRNARDEIEASLRTVRGLVDSSKEAAGRLHDQIEARSTELEQRLAELQQELQSKARSMLSNTVDQVAEQMAKLGEGEVGRAGFPQLRQLRDVYAWFTKNQRALSPAFYDMAECITAAVVEILTDVVMSQARNSDFYGSEDIAGALSQEGIRYLSVQALVPYAGLRGTDEGIPAQSVGFRTGLRAGYRWGSFPVAEGYSALFCYLARQIANSSDSSIWLRGLERCQACIHELFGELPVSAAGGNVVALNLAARGQEREAALNIGKAPGASEVDVIRVFASLVYFLAFYNSWPVFYVLRRAVTKADIKGQPKSLFVGTPLDAIKDTHDCVFPAFQLPKNEVLNAIWADAAKGKAVRPVAPESSSSASSDSEGPEDRTAPAHRTVVRPGVVQPVRPRPRPAPAPSGGDESSPEPEPESESPPAPPRKRGGPMPARPVVRRPTARRSVDYSVDYSDDDDEPVDDDQQENVVRRPQQPPPAVRKPQNPRPPAGKLRVESSDSDDEDASPRAAARPVIQPRKQGGFRGASASPEGPRVGSLDEKPRGNVGKSGSSEGDDEDSEGSQLDGRRTMRARGQAPSARPAQKPRNVQRPEQKKAARLLHGSSESSPEPDSGS